MLDRILIGASSTETTDPDFENVTLLLHGDGSNGAQNNTFIDSSTNNFTITRNGNTTQGSFSPYGSNWSNYFDGSGDSLSLASASAFALGSGDFTLEYWVYYNSLSTNQTSLDFRNGSPSDNAFSFYQSSTGGDGKLYVATATTNRLVSNAALSANTWTHIAVVRSSGVSKLYINGVAQSQTWSDTTDWSTNKPLRIGSDYNSTNPVNGYISNVRVVKGTAVYTANFTPSTTPLTAITNTSLLTCADNRFRDGSTNNFTITRNGDVKVTNFAPFAPSSAYSTTTNGGSAYFDGSGDYLSTSSNTAFAFGTGDFAIECWVYRLDSNGTGLFESRGGTAGFLWYIDGANQYPRFYDQNTAAHFTGTVTVPVGAWTHLAVTRSSGTLYFWVNGQAAGSNAYTVNVGSTATLRFYASNDAAAYLGYGSNMRAVKGSAVYTAAFTPPSSPVTAITNTSLLLNATNAAIFDNSMKNDLETVGNAQISTSVKKFGTGSMYLDGTGDWLTYATTDVNKFGSGDFTIEGWIYRNNSSDGGFYSDRVASPDYSGMVIYIKSDKVAMLVSTNGSSWGLNTVAATEGNSVPTTAWSHLAITRSGSTWRVFIDGTLSYSKTLSGSVSQTQSVAYIGADIPDGKYLNGYIDDLRITKGVARYTANFTAPTAPFPNK